MVSKELLERAKKCTSREEILELAKKENVEVSEDEIKALLATSSTNRELSDEELENVNGGTCYSSDTFADLGITPVAPLWGEQLPSYHPMITTAGNLCGVFTDRTLFSNCGNCDYSIGIGLTLYCKARSKEFDPTKK